MTVVSDRTADPNKSHSIKPIHVKPKLALQNLDIVQEGLLQPSNREIRTALPVGTNPPTHPLFPDVLGQFPPFKYTTPPVRPQVQPLQVVDKLAGSGQKLLPLTSADGRNTYIKKCRTPLLALS
jgi:hypothetical protein